MAERSRQFIDKVLYFAIERLLPRDKLHRDRPLTVESAQQYVKDESLLTLCLMCMEGHSKSLATRENFASLPAWLEHCLITTFVERNVDRHFFVPKFQRMLVQRGYEIQTEQKLPKLPAKRVTVKGVPKFSEVKVLDEVQACVLLEASASGTITEEEIFQLRKYKFIGLLGMSDDVQAHWKMYLFQSKVFFEIMNCKRRTWQTQLKEDFRIPFLLQPIEGLMPKAGKRLKVAEDLARGLGTPSLFGFEKVHMSKRKMKELDVSLDRKLAASANIEIKHGRYPPFVQALRGFGLNARLQKPKKDELPRTSHVTSKQMVSKYLAKWCPEILGLGLSCVDLRRFFREEVAKRRAAQKTREPFWIVTNKHKSLYESFKCEDWREQVGFAFAK
jgi:hypothetical protein